MAKQKKCSHGVPESDQYGCPACKPELFKKSTLSEICEHHIIRKSCQFCPQAQESVFETPEMMAAWHKAMSIQKSEKFVIRNFITEHMHAICAWDSYTDTDTGKNVNGGSAFLVLLALAQYAWTDPATVFPGNTKLAAMTGLSEGYIRRVKRMWIDIGVLSLDRVGKSIKHTDRVIVGLDKIKRFVEMAEINVGGT
jgi:hypothetical protein